MRAISIALALAVIFVIYMLAVLAYDYTTIGYGLHPAVAIVGMVLYTLACAYLHTLASRLLPAKS